MRVALAAALAALVHLSCTGDCAVDCRAAGATSQVRPSPDARNVPTNTRIWVGAGNLGLFTGGSDDVKIIGPDGAEVPFERQRLAGGFEAFDVLRPQAELVPQSVYAVTNGGTNLTHFRTGDGPDHTVPAVPREVSVSEVESHECGDEYGFDIVLASDPDAAFFVTDRSRESGRFDPAFPSGTVTVLSLDGKVLLGRGACFATWPEADPGASVSVRHRAIDLAGNVSEWSDVSTRGLGCQSAGGVGAAALAGFAVRRRARRPRQLIGT